MPIITCIIINCIFILFSSFSIFLFTNTPWGYIIYVVTIIFSGGMIMSVKVYSTPSCPWCTVAKRYLASKNVTYTDVDVSKDRNGAMEMIRKSGQRGVPVLDINGNIIVGFNQEAIDRLLSA